MYFDLNEINKQHKKDLKALKKASKEYLKSLDTPEKVLQALIATGMYTKTGKLKKKFR